MREGIIIALKRGVFPYIDGFKAEKESDKESDKELDEHEEINTTDMPDLENEESATEGQGLKLLTTNQLLSRLPIILS